MGESHIYPEFFKVFIPQSSSQRLLIPTAFLACIEKVVPNKVILRNRHGRLWQVEVVKTDNGVYFRNGWVNFVKDNSLELGEFIVFRYNGDYIFYVKCFGRSGCEKKDTMTSASIAKKNSFIKIEEDEEEEEEEEEEKGKHSEKQKEKVIEEEDDDGDNDDDDNIYKEEDFDDDDEEEDDDDDNGDNDEDEKDYDDDEEEEEDDNGDNDEEEKDYDDDYDEEEAKAYGRGHRKIGLLLFGGCKATADMNINGHKERTPIVKDENCNGIDVRRYVQPKNPYFVTRLLSWKRGKVYVPTNLLRTFDIQLRQKMILRDQYGRKWPGNVSVWKDGRSWIGGWNTFCKWNKVTQQDICICEFMRGRGYMGNLIQVHIVRAGQAPDSHQKPVARGDTADMNSDQLN